MKKIQFASFVGLSLIAVTLSQGGLIQKAQAQEETFALCKETRNKIRVYSLDGKMMRRGSDSNNNSRTSAMSSLITGTITYRQRIALAPGAVIRVKLLDVSKQDVAAEVISEQIITTTGEQVPIPFKLKFNPETIEPRHSYAVRAEIKIEDKLAFTTTRNYPVITNGNPLKVNLVLDKINTPNLLNQLMEGEWLLEDLGGRGVLDNLQTTLKFDQDGRLGGSGGCNRYFASYQLEKNNFKVGLIGATKRACPEAIMNQEDRYLKALGEAYRIRISKGFLLIDSQELEKPLKFTLKQDN